MGKKKISIIGAGVVDILVGAVDEKIFSRSSTSADFIKFSFGGDALNEAIVLSRLGKNVQWISNVGDDDAGKRILNYAEENNLSVDCIKVQAGLETSITIVLVDARGERYFTLTAWEKLFAWRACSFRRCWTSPRLKEFFGK